MHTLDKNKIINRYESRLKEFGPQPQALGWFKGRQKYRFHFLAEIDGFEANDSVLDVGCAYGDMELFLRSLSWKGEYCGVDIVPGLIKEGKRKYPDSDLRLLDIQKEKLGKIFDWVFCSGALTSKTDQVDSYDQVESMLGKMLNLCKKGISANFVSPYVDYQSEINFHPDMSRLIEIITRLTRRFTLRHDYMPYEFTVYLYKDQNIIREANIFKKHQDIYKSLKTG